MSSVDNQPIFDRSLPVPAAWADAQPHSHLVQFYESDSFLVDALSEWFRDGLNAGDACLYIGTESHRVGMEDRLADRGFDLAAIRADGRYISVDADEALRSFMVDEWPDETLFIRAF